MMLLDLLKEGTEQPYTDLIGTVIIITIFREITLCFVIYYKTSLVTNCLNLSILDSRKGIYYM